MITIGNQPLQAEAIINQYPENSIERKILNVMTLSSNIHSYNSVNQLKFELELRREIVYASEALYRSGLSFRVFRDSICNPAYWERMNDGGFKLRADVKPSDAVRDIYINGHLYGTECATAMLMVYYKALVEIFPDELFNRIFTNIYLMNWHRIEREIREVGYMNPARDYLPGDRRYVANPDVNPLTPEWQGENLIDLGNGLYYGHGIGRYPLEAFIRELNRNRKRGAERSAYLMDTVGLPDFKKLFSIYER